MIVPSFEGRNLSALAQLVAIRAANGTTSKGELVKATGYSERAIWKAKAELKDCTLNPSAPTTAPECTLHTAPECTLHTAPECTAPLNPSAPCTKEISPTPPKENIIPTQEQPSSEITGSARARGFAGRFASMTEAQVAELDDLYPRLSFPGDLKAADEFFAKEIRGKIDHSPNDDRLAKIYGYLAKRNRETPEPKADQPKPQVIRKLTRYQGIVELPA